jgi:arylsulfatase
MFRYILFLFALRLFSLQCKEDDVSKPNIIFIFADDLGYGELGSYGQEKIETPNLDELARNGMRFTQYYSGSPVCAPSRCILMTGQHSGHAYIRGNDEVRSRGAVWDHREMAKNPGLEGQYPLADSIVTVAEKLKDGGYSTALFGKWGLGYPGSESLPNTQGFDYFYGYNCQRQAHNLTPLHLWRNNEKDRLKNDTLIPRTPLDEGADPYDPNSYEKYNQTDYAPTFIFNDLMTYVDTVNDAPFCIFWESPIPHVPLQAPQKWVDHYVQKFGDEEPYLGDKGYFPCRYPNATYAAMISYLDENIGHLIGKLKEKGVYDNTLIMFSSDNGPTYAGGVDASYFDSARPFKSERGWAKGFVREGGIRVPLIASWPNMIDPGSESNHIASSQDIFPTFCDIAGVEYEGNPIDGISFKASLIQNGSQTEHEHLYWEFPEGKGQVAVRKGKWKAFVPRVKEGNRRLELYNLELDPLETNDVASENEELVSDMWKIIYSEHTTSFHPRWQLALLDQ